MRDEARCDEAGTDDGRSAGSDEQSQVQGGWRSDLRSSRINVCFGPFDRPIGMFRIGAFHDGSFSFRILYSVSFALMSVSYLALPPF